MLETTRETYEKQIKELKEENLENRIDTIPTEKERLIQRFLQHIT